MRFLGTDSIFTMRTPEFSFESLWLLFLVGTVFVSSCLVGVGVYVYQGIASGDLFSVPAVQENMQTSLDSEDLNARIVEFSGKKERFEASPLGGGRAL